MKELAMFFAGLATLGAALLTSVQVSADTPGTGGVNVDRLPWLVGERRQLTQGWFGHGSHYSQFGEDWTARSAQGTPIQFQVYAVAEGDATCHNNAGDSSGEWISLERSTAGVTWDWTDYYFHLSDQTCGPGGWTKHFEQGDALATATGTGTFPVFVHLHYEPRNGPGPANSVNHCESGLCNFCDHNDSGQPDHDGEPNYTCTQVHYNEWYRSDNAGPGVGAPTAVKNQIYWTYKVVEAIACPNQGWNCIGSSIAAPEAFPYTWAGDPGWHQWFLTIDDIWNAFNRPDACDKAYHVLDEYFTAWFSNANELGQARSGATYISFFGAWFQFFHDGFMYSSQYGQDPTVVLNSPTTTCY